jgi:hypothetical protein
MKKHPLRSLNTRLSTRTIARSLIAASLLAPVLGVTAQARASTPLIDASFRSLRLMDNGSVRVVAEYTCPGGYGYRPQRYGAFVGVAQNQEGQTTSVGAGERFEDEVVCDGTPKVVVKRVRPIHHQRFDERFPVFANLQLDLFSQTEPSPGSLITREQDMFRLQARGDATLVGDVNLGRIRLNDFGELVVGLNYECPTGWGREPDDRHYITAVVYMPDGDAASYSGWIRRDLVCDNETHRIKKRVNPVSAAVSGTFRIAYVTVDLDLYEVATDTHLHVVEGLTLSD